uniref:7TM_GPCR_Srx domain-containing protein n=1 Tax=Heterorhabditis bacteriophora TaxID=37862 RepID=A0A1I7X238_HETBA
MPVLISKSEFQLHMCVSISRSFNLVPFSKNFINIIFLNFDSIKGVFLTLITQLLIFVLDISAFWKRRNRKAWYIPDRKFNSESSSVIRFLKFPF